MVGNSKWDRVFATASWIIVIFLFISAYTVMFVSPPAGSGPVASLIGIAGAKIFYFVLYLVEAIVLAYSKFFKKKNLRKHTLVAIYCTGAFTSLLTLVGVGWSTKVIDNIVVTVVSAGCWLYWKFKTEYIDPATFEQDVDGLRSDGPPSLKYKE